MYFTGSNYNVAILYRPTNLICNLLDPDCSANLNFLGYPNESGRIRSLKIQEILYHLGSFGQLGSDKINFKAGHPF